MRYHEFLIERVVNLHSTDEKMAYADQVWDMLQRSYKKIGGFKSAGSPEELANDSGYWKLVRRGDKITALGVYKKSPKTKNFKLIASATETELNPETGEYKATPQGLKDYNMVKTADIKTKRSWAEVSGPAEKVMIRSGAIPISSKYAEFLTGKKILDYNPDGNHYTRLIQGEPHEKIIMGFVNLSPEGKKELIQRGFDINELPPNIAADI
jgi:hypothetical protein